MVLKKGTLEWTVVEEFHALNAQTAKKRYPNICIADLSSELHGGKGFSYTHAIKAYHKIPINPGDTRKTATFLLLGLF
ncbi:retrovirus-related Pol polyprotein from transposon opus [Nephila pilipes]|uniref:Retrovirus-related Pol polyprotein from transposon opus n=1 Tax=Nephila pilipes TaxID=299642 RepID=A0A8X6QQY1_NEPPI|nr:retrovirus-related Pol polyprotein from transposon opus [Nephila pilipes]